MPEIPKNETAESLFHQALTLAGHIQADDYESPLEQQFLWEFLKVNSEEVEIHRQFGVETDGGNFRLDFAIQSRKDGRIIGLECDGKDFHDANKDKVRDSRIVNQSNIQRVYRIRGRDICWNIYEVLDLLSKCEPWMFSERGMINLAARTHPDNLREDSIGRYSLFFPFAAVRRYLSGDNEESTVIDEGSLPPWRPIIICWTQSERGSASNPYY